MSHRCAEKLQPIPVIRAAASATVAATDAHEACRWSAPHCSATSATHAALGSAAAFLSAMRGDRDEAIRSPIRHNWPFLAAAERSVAREKSGSILEWFASDRASAWTGVPRRMAGTTSTSWPRRFIPTISLKMCASPESLGRRAVTNSILMSAPRVAAVVVTYNRPDDLERCLSALAEQSHPLARTLVIDNASDAPTAQVLARFPLVEVERLEENTGSSGGFAVGVERSAGFDVDWLWVMDDDAVAQPDALERLLASPPAGRPRTAALGCLKIGADDRPQVNHAGAYAVGRARILPCEVDEGGPVRVDYLSFVGLLVRREVAAQEPVRADFFISLDDVEYSLRLRRHGALFLVPSSVIVHLNTFGGRHRKRLGRTVALGGAWRTYYTVRNRMLIQRAHGTRRQRWGGAAWGLARVAGRTVAAFVYHEQPATRAAMAWRGWWDGVRGRSGGRVRP